MDVEWAVLLASLIFPQIPYVGCTPLVNWGTTDAVAPCWRGLIALDTSHLPPALQLGVDTMDVCAWVVVVVVDGVRVCSSARGHCRCRWFGWGGGGGGELPLVVPLA